MAHVSNSNSFPRPPRRRAGVLTLFPGLSEQEPTTQQEDFVLMMSKYLREDVIVSMEATAEVRPGQFSPFDTHEIGVLLERPTGGETGRTRRVAFEIGAAPSMRDDSTRTRRDATLLARGVVSVVYRLRRVDLIYSQTDVIYIASRLDPDLFSERGRINLETLASPEARAAVASVDMPDVRIYATGHTAATDKDILVRRLDARFPADWREHAAPAVGRVTTPPTRLAG